MLRGQIMSVLEEIQVKQTGGDAKSGENGTFYEE